MKSPVFFLKLIALIGILFFISCKKETIEIEKKTTVFVTTDSTIIIDTVIGRPYQWNSIYNGSIRKLIDISAICDRCNESVLDVYWGSGGTNWLRLPFVDHSNSVSVNYQWTDSVLYVFAYGDSTKLADTAYWDRLRLNTLKIKFTIKK